MSSGDYDLKGRPGHVSLNGLTDTIGIGDTSEYTNNQTRTAHYNPNALLKWAEAVADAYGTRCKVIFTPDSPIMATHKNEESTIGVGLAPMRSPDMENNDD